MNMWSIGGIVAGLVGVLFVSAVLGVSGWRYALLFGAVSAMYGLYARRLIPESPRWLASQGRVAEANIVIERVSGIPRDRAEYLPAELTTSVREQLQSCGRITVDGCCSA